MKSKVLDIRKYLYEQINNNHEMKGVVNDFFRAISCPQIHENTQKTFWHTIKNAIDAFLNCIGWHSNEQTKEVLLLTDGDKNMMKNMFFNESFIDNIIQNASTILAFKCAAGKCNYVFSTTKDFDFKNNSSFNESVNDAIEYQAILAYVDNDNYLKVFLQLQHLTQAQQIYKIQLNPEMYAEIRDFESLTYVEE